MRIHDVDAQRNVRLQAMPWAQIDDSALPGEVSCNCFTINAPWPAVMARQRHRHTFRPDRTARMDNTLLAQFHDNNARLSICKHLV